MKDKEERYLNCKYLDAGMDGMLCSMSLCVTCKEFNGEKCSSYVPKDKSKYKEKQIEEMANLIYDNRPIKDIWNEEAEEIAKMLYNVGYRKLDDHAIMVLRKAKGMEDKIRKETAREILNELYNREEMGFDVIKWYAKEYWGVEIKE